MLENVTLSTEAESNQQKVDKVFKDLENTLKKLHNTITEGQDESRCFHQCLFDAKTIANKLYLLDQTEAPMDRMDDMYFDFCVQKHGGQDTPARRQCRKIIMRAQNDLDDLCRKFNGKPPSSTDDAAPGDGGMGE
jgi:hypothetical protein